MLAKFKIYIVIAIVVAAAAAGWTGRDWYQSHLDQQVVEKQEEYRKGEAAIAALVEQQLTEFKQNERVIERHTREIVKRDSYRVECIDDDGLRIIKAYATGRATDLTEELPR